MTFSRAMRHGFRIGEVAPRWLLFTRGKVAITLRVCVAITLRVCVTITLRVIKPITVDAPKERICRRAPIAH
jgi:hypothetical protein